MSDIAMPPDGDAPTHRSSLNGQSRVVHTITDRFSMANTYLICESRVVVVNPRSSLNVSLLRSYMQHILHRPMSDIDLIVLTFLHPDYTSGLESLHRFCSAPVAASTLIHTLPQRIYRSPYDTSIDLWLDDNAALPAHTAWRVLTYPGRTTENLLLYNVSTQELICGDLFTVFEGNPIIRSEADIRRQHLEELLRLVRGLNVSYLYPIRGRQLLRNSPFVNTRIE